MLSVSRIMAGRKRCRRNAYVTKLLLSSTLSDISPFNLIHLHTVSSSISEFKRSLRDMQTYVVESSHVTL